MLSDEQIRKIRRLRDECYSWEEIAERTGLPKTVCFYAMRRRKNKADYWRRRAKKQEELIRTLRSTIWNLQGRLSEEVSDAGQ